MNEHEAYGLGQRAKKCDRWQWLPGMRTLNHQRVVKVDTDGRILAASKGYFGDWTVLELDPEATPDLRDAATLGCLAALVREVHHDPTLSAVGYEREHGDGRVLWRIDARMVDDPMADIPNIWDLGSEAEALVRALEDSNYSRYEDEA